MLAPSRSSRARGRTPTTRSPAAGPPPYLRPPEPCHRRPEVSHLRVETVHPLALIRPGERGFGPLGQPQEEVRVPATDGLFLRPTLRASPRHTARRSPASGSAHRRRAVPRAPATCPPACRGGRGSPRCSTPSSEQTASAASRVKPFANAEIRRNNARSLSESNSWLQSIVARRVLWRGRATRLPPVSNRKRSSRRAAIWDAESTLILTAASSMASGMPSSLWQMRATAGAFCSSSSKPGAAASARSTNRRTDLMAHQLLGNHLLPRAREARGRERARPSHRERSGPPGWSRVS